MRFIKWILLALVLAYVVFEIIINLGTLGQDMAIKINLPWEPLGIIVMPFWAALVLAALFAFVLAVLLEIAAWYEYTRTIRLQRKQIRALQKKLDQETGSFQEPAASE